ncbi:MAG: OmpA family protein [Bacteroidota bacterium]
MNFFKPFLLSIITILTLLLLTPKINAQYSGSKNAISLSGVGVDYNSIFMDDFLNTDFWTGQMKWGYHRNLYRDFLNLEIPFNVGGARVPIIDTDDVNAGDISKNSFKASLGGLLQLQYFKKSNFLVPYLSAGVVGAFVADEGDWHAEIPLGVGLDVKITPRTYFQLRPEYRVGLVDDDRSNLNLNVGVKFFLNGGDDTPPPPPVDTDRDKDGVNNDLDKCPDVPGLHALAGCPDTDGDGIADGDDSCPTVAGLTQFKGCPDTDGDGLADANDKCPTEAGPAANLGCPYGDSDGDGVTDDVDLCKDQAGLAKFDGCPDSDSDGVADKDDDCPNRAGMKQFRGCPDTDGDGVSDNKDKCPTEAGLKSNDGCPEVVKEVQEAVSFAANNIEFKINSSTIKTSSYTDLDNIANILEQYPEYNVAISGHTDNIGKDNYNLWLSERRAKSCMTYLTNKGISPTRMTATGYGETQPIGDNKTAAGRQMNRRVEFSLFKR